MRKIFIDCGANVGQSIDLFINNWEDAKSYEIFSFEANKDFEEILNKKRDEYNREGYIISTNVPVAVWDKETEDELSIFGGLESAIVSDKNEDEIGSSVVALSPSFYARKDFKPSSIRLSTWIKENFSKPDYLILKMDIEGSEYRVIRDMHLEGSLSFVSEFYYEWHGPKKGFSFKDDMEMLDILAEHKVTPYHWNGNWDKMRKNKVTKEMIENFYKRKGFKT